MLSFGKFHSLQNRPVQPKFHSLAHRTSLKLQTEKPGMRTKPLIAQSSMNPIRKTLPVRNNMGRPIT
jgi:hypothetical protein